MKQVFVFHVLICSLLLAICGCPNEVPSRQETAAKKPDLEGSVPPLPADPKPPITGPVFIIPEILINELRTEYNTTANRAEFIEFKVNKAGNLQGIKLYIMWNAINPYVFSLPAIEVKAGEYITYHLRTLESSCVNELGENLSLSGGTDSSPTARDLWVSGSEKWLHKTDIVYLQDANSNILDAVIMNENPNTAWVKDKLHFEEIAAFLYNKGAWKSPDGQLPNHLDAVDTSEIGSSATRSVSRIGNIDTNTKNDWYVTDTNGVTPGN